MTFRTSPLESRVGNTPLLDLSDLVGRPGVELYAKAEWHNPGGSVKDRPAHRIVSDAIARGDLRPGVSLLDATSGNTGIAYAWLGAAKGFPVTLTMSEGASPARKRILQAYGARLIYTDPAETTDGAIRRARELVAEDPGSFYYADQYNNASNLAAHRDGTGPEIWKQTAGRVTHFIAGLGTSGTLMGTGSFLREAQPDIQLVGLQPDAPFHGLEGLKHMETAIVPGIYNAASVDHQVTVPTEAAYAQCRALGRDSGLLVGVSGGAAVAAALELAGSLEEGVIVTVLPDSGERYLSEPFWTEPERPRPAPQAPAQAAKRPAASQPPPTAQPRTTPP